MFSIKRYFYFFFGKDSSHLFINLLFFLFIKTIIITVIAIVVAFKYTYRIEIESWRTYGQESMNTRNNVDQTNARTSIRLTWLNSTTALELILELRQNNKNKEITGICKSIQHYREFLIKPYFAR